MLPCEDEVAAAIQKLRGEKESPESATDIFFPPNTPPTKPI
jgi:hypothetical protein